MGQPLFCMYEGLGFISITEQGSLGVSLFRGERKLLGVLERLFY